MGKYVVVSLHTETKVSMKVMYTFKIVGQLLPLNECCWFFLVNTGSSAKYVTIS